ncbi:MAG: 50S ribosomal protein L5 [Candidatus Gracilibacteria bacterium]|nr:50S ribosomal protein L5 [Candidatus Gracilibacteria bacterium]
MKRTSELYERYRKDIRPKLQKELGIKNPMQIPQIQKICVNVGMGSYLQKLNSKDFSFVEENLTNITGQKPVLRKSKMSVSNFKVREGQPIGLSVTLRNQEAYNFLHKLINVAYPRVRDFRGVARNCFDKDGNCSVGFKDHTAFPEGKKPEDSRKIHGMQVSIITSTSDIEHSRKLLESLGFPFKKPVKPEAHKES